MPTSRRVDCPAFRRRSVRRTGDRLDVRRACLLNTVAHDPRRPLIPKPLRAGFEVSDMVARSAIAAI
jgi:hypothetical protein